MGLPEEEAGMAGGGVGVLGADFAPWFPLLRNEEHDCDSALGGVLGYCFMIRSCHNHSVTLGEAAQWVGIYTLLATA